MSSHLRVLVAILALVIPSAARADAIVNYSGTVYEGFSSPTPAPNSYVIAGTFAPGYDWTNYTCDYGVDEVCNMDDNGFERAVSDGNLFPIGSGTLANASGLFNGSGTTSATAGTPIFLFAFDGPNSSGFIQSVAFSTSTDPSFLVPASGIAALDSSLTDVHILGGTYVMNGLVLSGGLPVPEPTSAAIAMLCASALLSVRARSSSQS